MSAQPSPPIDFRDASDATFAAILALNNDFAVETSELNLARLKDMARAACFARYFPPADAFLLAFDQDASYDSPNFFWFRDRLPRFVYIDRVVVAATARRHGHARTLYDTLFQTAVKDGHDTCVCEVNVEPPNLQSDAFHARMGFAEIGRAQGANGKVVRYLSRHLR